MPPVLRSPTAETTATQRLHQRALERTPAGISMPPVLRSPVAGTTTTQRLQQHSHQQPALDRKSAGITRPAAPPVARPGAVPAVLDSQTSLPEGNAPAGTSPHPEINSIAAASAAPAAAAICVSGVAASRRQRVPAPSSSQAIVPRPWTVPAVLPPGLAPPSSSQRLTRLGGLPRRASATPAAASATPAATNATPAVASAVPAVANATPAAASASAVGFAASPQMPAGPPPASSASASAPPGNSPTAAAAAALASAMEDVPVVRPSSQPMPVLPKTVGGVARGSAYAGSAVDSTAGASVTVSGNLVAALQVKTCNACYTTLLSEYEAV